MIIKKTYIIMLLSFVLAVPLGMLTGCDNVQGLEIVVSNTEDSGEGSLRRALEIAEAGDTIIFDPEIFSPDGPTIINIQSRLPGLDQGSVTIDASNAGVILNGAFAGENIVNGLEILSSNNTIRGLQIINFQNGAGIALSAEAKDNLIGGNRATGSGPCGQGNQLSANQTGISLAGSSVAGNIITGNLIGTNENGQRPYRNIGNNNGILISNGASANIIGEDNIIAFNEAYGVHILGDGSERNTITRNIIFSNGFMAIYLEGGNAGLAAPVITEYDINSGTVKGSACAGCTVELFSSNGREGKYFEGDAQVDKDGRFSFSGGRTQAPCFTVTVTDAEGNTSEFSASTEVREIVVVSTEDRGEGTLRQALQEATPGDIVTFNPEVFPPENPATIYLERGLPVIHQGYLTLDASNAGVILDGIKIDDEFCSGLSIHSDNNTIQGLWFNGFAPGTGIEITGSNNLIGGDPSKGSGLTGQGVLVSHGDLGIMISNSTASYNMVMGNFIGTDPDGNDLGNSGSGFWIESGATYNLIGPGNVIAHNGVYGIEIVDSNTTGNTITENSIYHNERSAIRNLGIEGERAGGNMELDAPIIFSFDLASGTLSGQTYANCVLEIFSDEKGQGFLYEGGTISDANGSFNFNNEDPFTGPSLTITATDRYGNTSAFSAPTYGQRQQAMLQANNNFAKTMFQPKASTDLMDNRLGEMYYIDRDIRTEEVYSYFSMANEMGLTWLMLNADWNDWPEVEITGIYSDYDITEYQQQALEIIHENNINIKYTITYWDPEIETYSGYTRFRTEEEIERFMDYVRYIVSLFKGRVDWYSLLNEPNCEGYDQRHVRVEDYIKVARRVIPLIRELDPEAGIVIGEVTPLNESDSYEYLMTILKTEDIMSAVDGIAWHGSSGNSLEYQPGFYNNYPAWVDDIVATSREHGFEGQFFATEIHYRTPETPQPIHGMPWFYSDIVSAKYYARAIVWHLERGFMVGIGHEGYIDIPPVRRVIHNLATLMAGAVPADLEVGIETEAESVQVSTFMLPEGSYLVALWRDGIAVDDDPGIAASLTVKSLAGYQATGIDALVGYEQLLTVEEEIGGLVIRDLLIKDYPIFLKLSN
jgi:hypothetical protein